MEGRIKYAPSKTRLTVAESKKKLKEATAALRKANAALEESVASLKFARDLICKQDEEIRRLKLIILRMSEGKWDGNAETDSR